MQDLWLAILLKKSLGQHLSCDLTGENVDCLLCCTFSLVWDNSSCLWILLHSIIYIFCNCFSLSLDSPTALAASRNKLKLSLSSKATCHPLYRIVVNLFLFMSLSFQWTLSLPSLAYLTFGVSHYGGLHFQKFLTWAWKYVGAYLILC